MCQTEYLIVFHPSKKTLPVAKICHKLKNFNKV